jgi:hypothetical protein
MYTSKFTQDERAIQEVFINDLFNSINCKELSLPQHKIIVTGISILVNPQLVYRYLIILPFVDQKLYLTNNYNIPYIYMQDYIINTNIDYVKYMFENCNQNKSPVLLYRLDNTMTGKFDEIKSSLHINISKNEINCDYDFDLYITHYNNWCSNNNWDKNDTNYNKILKTSFTINHHISMGLFPTQFKFKYGANGTVFGRV